MKKILLITLFMSLAAFAADETIIAPQTDYSVTNAVINTEGVKSEKVRKAEERSKDMKKERIQLDRDLIQHQRALNVMTTQQNQMLNF